MNGYFREFNFPLEGGAKRRKAWWLFPRLGTRITSGRLGPFGPYELPAYYIDRFEVTNSEYQKFVDRGWLRKARVLEAHVHSRWPRVELGSGDGSAARFDRPSRAVHVEGRPLSGGASGVSGRRRELVRGCSLCRVRRQEPTYNRAMVSGSAEFRRQIHNRHEQLLVDTCACGQVPRCGTVGHLRHGWQCRGVVLE